MFDVISIGSAFQDVYVFSKKFKVVRDSRTTTGTAQMFAFGTKIELDDILFEIGGGATNTSYTFARQGLRTACISRVGDDGSGKEVSKFLKKNRITDKLIIDRQRRTAHSVVFLGKKGERTLLVYRGAAHNFSSRDFNLNGIKNTKWLYISSLAGNLSLLEKIMRYANSHNIKVALNPGKLEIRQNKKKLAKIIKTVKILFVNREEAVMINKRAYGDDQGLLKDLTQLCPNVIAVTEGAGGSLVADGQKHYHIKIKPVKSIDTTGAGDAFGSGFLAGYIKNHGNIQKAIALACANSASVVQKIGAKHGLLTKASKVQKSRVTIQKIK
ncbi:carbohydrate kinase family protein [Patescibacteria group bacterium]|nr:carbohydrate kinase family protein [Patescibacteria group bacterium]MBU0964220.1 carbohydrate kinase family protein [Patescibacteria group bacterium]